MSLELPRNRLPPGLDVGDRFVWEDGQTYKATLLGTNWVTAVPVGEPGQKPAAPPAVPQAAPAPVAPPPPEPASRDAGSTIAAPIVEQAPAIDGEKSASRDAGSVTVDAEPVIPEAPPVAEEKSVRNRGRDRHRPCRD